MTTSPNKVHIDQSIKTRKVNKYYREQPIKLKIATTHINLHQKYNFPLTFLKSTAFRLFTQPFLQHSTEVSYVFKRAV